MLESNFKVQPVAGIYESMTPRFAGFIVREKDLQYSYQGGFGDWIVLARPFDLEGYTPSSYGDDYSHPFVYGRDIGELIEKG
jgi:hypothetical protein